MRFQLITSAHLKKLDIIISALLKKHSVPSIINDLSCLIDEICNDIPMQKRISSGKYSVIKELGLVMYDKLEDENLPIYEFALQIFIDYDIHYITRGLALQLITICGLEDLDKVWPYIIEAASSENWIMREFAVGFVRKLLKKYPKNLKDKYMKLLQESDDANLRRFVAESLRPGKENSWFIKIPEYQLSMLRKMFREKFPYSRTSVGNNLSDWARTYPEMVYGIVEELVKSKDKNSYWIAYRACRNLVKKEPIRVMNLLQVDEYKYKTRIFYRKDNK
jgi:3-methyladenine DNA glycosylase AlkC